jgi:hypothetical protein
VTNEVRKQLRDADPVQHEPPIPAADVHSMRGVVLSAARTAPQYHNRPRMQAAGAIVLACTVVIGLAIATWFRSDRAPMPPATAPRHDEPRQLQFETPGGTRIIWVLNPNLEL